ncbi:MAG: hypothetical protein HY901_35945 [Deltaproteobacteria bacterium]|nr:hypothetical protein [Deltaproteobacteria bacterium]
MSLQRYRRWAFTVAALLPVLVWAGEPVSRRLEKMLLRGDLDALTLELASLDPDELPTKDRSKVAEVLARAAEAAVHQGDASKALFFGLRVGELQPGPERCRWRASLAHTLSDDAAEAGALDDLLRHRPRDRPALIRRAQLHEASGAHGLALTCWKRAAEEGADPAVEVALRRAQARAEDSKPAEEAAALPAAKSDEPAAKPHDPPAREPSQAAQAPRRTPRDLPESVRSRPPAATHSQNEHFRLTYSDKGGEHTNREYGQKVLEVLERVWTFVCPRLERCPSRAVPVMLYTSEEFQASFGNEAFGRRSGFATTAIFVSWAHEMTPNVEATLAHEFVHVAINRHGGAPSWVHEGLATYYAGLFAGTGGGRQGFFGSTECLGIRAADAPPLADLDRRFPWSGSFAVSRPGYDYACAVARHLETSQPGKIGRLLDAFSAKKTDDAALRDVYGMDRAGLDAAVRATLPP